MTEKQNNASPSHWKRIWRILRILLLVGIVLGSIIGASYVMKLDHQVRAQFEGKRWALPARVFARPLELYEGKAVFADKLEEELKLLHYQKVSKPYRTGHFKRNGSSFTLHTRGFKFADDQEPAREILVRIKKGRIHSLRYAETKENISLMRLEPVLIGNFYPHHKEDRILVRLQDVPPMLINAFIAVEDKRFHTHWGVDPESIVRALVVNTQQGGTVQGGSTITQQLVKNFFLTNERSLKRKLNEAIMATLLEIHYEKNEILEAYLNEIYLGQDGERAIHGVGMAAQFYFGRPMNELTVEQQATLVALAKGASYYDPRRHPERMMKRRNLVITVLENNKVLAAEEATVARAEALNVIERKPAGSSPFPAYMDIVRDQLKRDYREEDLHSEGLLIFTSMDPIVQLTAEGVLQSRLKKLEKAHRKIPSGKLESAMVVTDVQGGILAVVGGRNVRYPGYNRALSAKRQIGSLVKPAVYLAALELSRRYTLATPISDGPINMKLPNGERWKPKNYDKRNLGKVMLHRALELSRNTPTIRISNYIKPRNVVNVLQNLGIKSHLNAFPSIALGAAEASPIEVAQMYQTLAAGGTYSPLKAIRSVMNREGETLQRYELEVRQVASREAVYLLNFALNRVTKQGTAKYLSTVLPSHKNSAGKTGTTDNMRDSWYAGFTGEHVAVVWVGRDDNKGTRLTGSSGALRVWADLMRAIPTKPYKPKKPRKIVWAEIDMRNGLLAASGCGAGTNLPFIRGSAPKVYTDCRPPEPEIPAWEQPEIADTIPDPKPAWKPASTPAPAPPPPQDKPKPVAPPTDKAADPQSWLDELMDLD